jgi:hypothetical protein
MHLKFKNKQLNRSVGQFMIQPLNRTILLLSSKWLVFFLRYSFKKEASSV